MCCVFDVRALGDKSELPSLVAAPLPVTSAADNTSDVDTDTQDCGIECELSDMAVSAVASIDASGQAGSRDVVSGNAECEDVTSSVNHSVAETEAAVEQDTEDGATAASSNCEAGADVAANNVDVNSDSKGEINCLII